MAPRIEEEHVETLSMNGNKMQVKDFIWSEEEWPALKHDDFGDVISDIPVISLNGIWENQELYENVCQDMVKASEKWGFFKLVDHGVPSEIVENYTSRLHELFDLPMEQKLQGGRTSSLPLGYYASNPEYEQNLPWAEILQLLQSPEMVVQFAKKVYGDQYHPFSNAMIEYMKEMDKLGMIIMEMLAHGLGLADDFFSKNFEEKEATIFRISKYPLCPLPEKIVGIGIHSDPQTLTILYQDHVGGLQILKDDKQWIGVRPLPNSFVINIGDTLEAWTNGRLKSVIHRAVVNKEKQRLSMAYFLNPTSSATIECPPQLIDPVSNPRKYVSFTWAELRHHLLTTRRVRGKAVAINKFLISS
ncbi:gibberellin 20 oxidase 1-like [Nicotiana tabacum]|uniref:Gibberellin 20 oxidase 1-like n=1 Tax=Nicotiana tabacum TaxID=4097 RepID=A0A1S4C3W2_TOBAC|nr:gibberellin 20 oxidase 1-like [Nicotiana tomentosiformis]XP_016495852.1 PREDICTED: gibberellin 20 oxidase 1-like [Nicotiana tabacum]